jgi:hypothetical protein
MFSPAPAIGKKMTKFIQLIPPFPHYTAPLILDGKKQRYATEKSKMINGLQDSRREDEPLNMQENG